MHDNSISSQFVCKGKAVLECLLVTNKPVWVRADNVFHFEFLEFCDIFPSSSLDSMTSLNQSNFSISLYSMNEHEYEKLPSSYNRYQHFGLIYYQSMLNLFQEMDGIMFNTMGHQKENFLALPFLKAYLI